MTVHAGDIGVVLRITLVDDAGDPIDISTASVTQIKLRAPDDDVLTLPASFLTDGTDGVIQYITQAGVLDVPGTWKYQAYVVQTSLTRHSDIAWITIKGNL